MHTSIHELAGQTPKYSLVERNIDCGILPCGNTLIGLPIAQVQHHLLGNPYQSPFWRQTKGIQSKGKQKRRSQPIIKGVLHHPIYTGTSSMDFFFRGWRLWHWVCLTVHITVIKPHITLISLMSSWYPELPMVKAHKSTMSFHISQH